MPTATEIPTIDATETKKRLDSGATVINALSAESFAKKHIPGTVNIPTDEVEERAETALPDTDMEIITYCAETDCPASMNAAKKLREMGYTNVTDFEAGLKGWKEAGFPLEGEEV